MHLESKIQKRNYMSYTDIKKEKVFFTAYRENECLFFKVLCK